MMTKQKKNNLTKIVKSSRTAFMRSCCAANPYNSYKRVDYRCGIKFANNGLTRYLAALLNKIKRNSLC